MSELETWLVSGLNEVCILSFCFMFCSILVFIVAILVFFFAETKFTSRNTLGTVLTGLVAILSTTAFVVIPDEGEYREIREAAAVEAAMATPTCECNKERPYE